MRRTSTTSRGWIALALALQAAGCASTSPGHSEVPAGPRRLGAVSSEERAGYVQRAQVWRPIATASLDLKAGPPGDDAYAFEQAVTCDYEPDKHAGTGKTSKFYCAVAPKDVVKVKYGSANREVYAEVAATRLFWALGFGTDRQYPVKVTCRNCSADPWRQRAAEPGVRTFDPAIIERPSEGTAIQVRNAAAGWSWSELRTIDERAGGAPRAQVEALLLLAAFVQHGDNQATQQRLACLPGAVERDQNGNETCRRPFLFTVDLGATFSRVARFRTRKFDLAAWEGVPVWEDRTRCIPKLERNRFTGTIENPPIGEAGRAFLAGLLMKLSEDQIRDLFQAARVDRLGDHIKDAEGRDRPVRVDDWVRAFLRKRAEVVDHRCPR